MHDRLSGNVVIGTMCLLVVWGFVGCNESGMRVDSIEPPFGNVAGNDDAVISGKRFTPGLVVQFGKRMATKVVIESDSKIRIKTPAGPEGKVDVFVIDQTGKSYVLKQAFTYRSESP